MYSDERCDVVCSDVKTTCLRVKKLPAHSNDTTPLSTGYDDESGSVPSVQIIKNLTKRCSSIDTDEHLYALDLLHVPNTQMSDKF